MTTSEASTHAVRTRMATPADAEPCGRICYEAFATINRNHNFPPDFPSADAAIGLLAMLFSHPGFYCVVAEADGRVVGSNCLDVRGAIAGLGPITVDPTTQNSGVGRALMEVLLEHGRSRGLAGIRLLQAAFHSRSLSLYTKLGFEAREPMSVMQGPPIAKKIEGCTVRPMTMADVAAGSRVCFGVHGHTRDGELRDAVAQGTATVVERHGRVTGYASSLSFFGHTVAESDIDLQALIASAGAFPGPGIIVPTRHGALLRWCLGHGLRVVMPMTLMTTGLYTAPTGAYLPSVLY